MLVGPAPVGERLERGVGNACLARQSGQTLCLGRFAHVQNNGVDRVHEDNDYDVSCYCKARLRNIAVLVVDRAVHHASMSDEIEQRRAAFAAFVKERGGVAKVARHAKVSQTTLYSYLTGKSASLLDRTTSPIASAYGVPIDELFGVEPATRQVPLAYYVGAGSEVHAFADGQGPFDYVDAPAEATANTVAGKIEGVSLGRVLDQAVVFWDDVHSPVTQDQYNRLCVCELHDGRVLVKEVQPARTPGLFHLFSETEPPILDVPLRWAAVVTSIRPR